MMKWLLRLVASVAALSLAAFWQLLLSARPPLTTDPPTLAGDGSTIDYCDLPELSVAQSELDPPPSRPRLSSN